MAVYKNLIFDVGDVIVHIDYKTTVAEFQKLAAVDFMQILSYNAQHKVFDLFETGKITAGQFRAEIKKFLKPGTTDEEIDRSWNSILIEYPDEKFRLLEQLKASYRTYALSNINEIHLETINRVAQSKFGVDDFAVFFHGAYYSNIVGHRKPEKEIYELILKQENLNPAETFFVDDKAENVEAAKTLGIQAYQLKNRNELFALLKDLKITG